MDTRDRWSTILLLAWAVFASPGCSSQTEGLALDAGIDASSGVAQLPRLAHWPCPAGWQPERIDAGKDARLDVCVPPARVACAPGQVQFIDATACHPLGGACPSGAFLSADEIAALAPDYAGRVLYVDPVASRGGDGTRARPFARIGLALDAAADGDIVALAQGTYSEGIRVQQRVAIVGACAAKTVIHAPPATATETDVVQLAQGGQSQLANLRVTGDRFGVRIQPGHRASLVAVDIAATVGAGVVVGARAEVLLQEVVVRDTRSISDGRGGNGLVAAPQASVTIDHAVFDHNREFAIWSLTEAGQEPPRFTLEDIVLENTQSNAATLLDGIGAKFFDGVNLVVRRALFAGNREAGLIHVFYHPASTPATIHLEDVVVRDTRSIEADGTSGMGIFADGCELTGERILLERNRTMGLFVHRAAGSPPTTATLTDLVIRDTLGQEGDKIAGGGLVSLGADRLSISRALLTGNRTAGLVAGAEPTAASAPTLELVDLVIHGTLADEKDGDRGEGLALVRAKATLERILVDGNRSVGAVIGWEGTLEAQDLTIRDTGSRVLGGRGGVGLQIQDAERATISRLRLERNRAAGLYLAAVDRAQAPEVLVRQAIVDDTLPAACAEPGAPASCVDSAHGVSYGGGSGVVVSDGARLVLESFEISDSALAGVQVEAGARLELRDGSVHHNEIGANIQGQSYDMSTVTNETVRYYENGSNVIATELPLPDPVQLPDLFRE